MTTKCSWLFLSLLGYPRIVKKFIFHFFPKNTGKTGEEFPHLAAVSPVFPCLGFRRKKNKSHRDIKRMLCECPPLSKEERAQGEVACGEDCLNRLLMIEW